MLLRRSAGDGTQMILLPDQPLHQVVGTGVTIRFLA
jgi:hypothetical protein